jgi:hypothetical protein
MRDSQSSSRANAAIDSSRSEVMALPPTDDDVGLLFLEEQFDELVSELLSAQPLGGELATCLNQQSLMHDVERENVRTKQAEAILARLYPIERAIMQTPARTIAGLGVKARHAAHVMSHYWEEPIGQIDWEAQAIRLLIEAVCEVARTPLPFSNPTSDE